MSTDREDFLATVQHRRPGQILYDSGFTPDLRERLVEHIGTEDIGGYYGFWQTAGLGPRRPDHIDPIDYSVYYEDEELPKGTRFNAVGAARIPSGFYHFYGYLSPLRNAESLQEIESYPLPDYSRWDTSHYEKTVRSGRADGKVIVGYPGHMYESAWQIRGYEQFLMDMAQRPEWVECLLDKIMAGNRFKAISAARAGADYLHCGDDLANQESLMFSKPMLKEFTLSRWKSIWAEVKEINPYCRIWYHTDGNIEEIVGDLVEAGVEILNPLQPEALDIDAVYEKYGDHITLDGTIGTQTTMPHGTPEDVRARVKEVIEKYGQNGGLIVRPTHHLEPEVPLENVDALFEACREYGRFE